MIQIRKILYPTDFSSSARQALDSALFLAERFGAELHLLHVHVLHADDPAAPAAHFPEAEELLRRLHEIAGSELAKLLEGRRSSAVALREFQTRGIAAAPVILDHIAQHAIDLVVMGTHGRRGPSRFFFGSVAAETVRYAPCPVLTLRKLPEGRPIETVDHLLVPIDFSSHSLSQLRYAIELGKVYGARLQLLHVIEKPVWPHFYSTLNPEAAAAEVTGLERRTEQALHQSLTDAGGYDDYEVHVRRGGPAAEITAFAGAESDMIAISTQGLGAVERFLLGSTAEQVVRTSEKPVFLTRPRRRSTGRDR